MSPKENTDVRLTNIIRGKDWRKTAWFAYPFALVHMGGFGTAVFASAYAKQDLGAVYIVGGMAALFYLIFYLVIFGAKEILWMFINSLIGILSVYAWLEDLAKYFIPDKSSEKITDFNDFDWEWHLFPGLLFVMYIFLIRNVMIDIVGARNNPSRIKKVNIFYIIFTVVQLGISFLYK